MSALPRTTPAEPGPRGEAAPADGGPGPATDARPRRALRRDLLIRLMLPLLLIVAATGGLGGFAAQRLADRVFDRWLLDAARSLAHQITVDHGNARVDLPPAAEAVLAYDETDRTWFTVSHAGRRIAGSEGIPASGEREADYPAGIAYDTHYDGEAVRVAAVRLDTDAGEVQVRVAETLHKRRHAAHELLLLLLPLVLLLVVAAAAILLTVSWTVRPLETIAARWNARSHASLQAIPAHDVPSELLPFANALNDLLERIRGVLERERRFAANAAHQLRTPLAGLQLGLARAAEAPDLVSTRAVLAELRATTQRTARLVQQLLALSRLDPEAVGDIGFADCDLASLAQDVGETFVDAAMARGVRLELVVPSTACVAHVHPELLSEALANLIDNALNHTPARGRIEIEVEPGALHVHDSGPGIAPAERGRVFERFVRGRDALGDGSGLGLAIVREIATLHGAEVTLGDSPLGGLKATLRFPGAAAVTKG